MKRRSTSSRSSQRPWHSLAGKNIWITGGAGHLGTPITRALDEAGARVLCIDLEDRAEKLVRSARLKNTRGSTWAVRDSAEIPAEVARLTRKHGVPDGLVHLAYASSSGKRVTELSAAEFQLTLDRSLPPTFELCRAVAQLMKTRGGGSVVLFSSMYGMVAPDPRNYPAGMAPNPIDYGASKAALQQMARYLAAHYGPDAVRFNCVVPGPFPNPTVQKQHPGFVRGLAARTTLRRIGAHDETVGPTLFLLTDSAAYVTGHSLVVDGGWMAW